jgi:hypothetical protein
LRLIAADAEDGIIFVGDKGKILVRGWAAKARG